MKQLMGRGYFGLILLVFLLCHCNSTKKKNPTSQPNVNIEDTTVINPVEKQNKAQEFSLADCKKKVLQWFSLQRDLDSQMHVTKGKIASLIVTSKLKKGDTYAILYYSTTDSTAEFQLLKKQDTGWQTQIQKSYAVYSDMSGSINQPLALVDYNFDEKLDIYVTHSQWDIHFGYRGALWLQAEKSFIPARGFDNIVTPSVDAENSIIVSYQSTGCADLTKHFEEYKWMKDSIVWKRSIDLDACPKNEKELIPDYCSIYESTLKKDADWDARAKRTVHWDSVHLFVPTLYSELTRIELKTVKQNKL